MSSSGESSASSATSIGGCPEFEIARVLASLGNYNINNINTKHNTVTVARAVVDGEEDNGSRHNSMEKNCMPWGSKGKRRSNSNSNSNSRRVKDSCPSSPTPFPFDLNLDQPSIFQEECQNDDVKVEEVCESIEPDFVNKLRNNCGRSRHNLTEEEKEARRIRRILANRESARQTIRRRQAFHEELTRKAADLASENERLKRSKEVAVKEFQSLQNVNQKLKGQLSQMSGIKNKGGNEASGTGTAAHSLHPANWSHYMYKNISASRPLVHPACVPPSDHLSQQLPWCILPCPVVLPMNGIHQLSSFENIGEGGFVDSKQVYSPSSVIHCLHSCPLVITADKKTGPVQTQGEPLNSFHQTLSGGSQTSCFSGGGLALERDDCISLHPHLNPDFPSAKSASSVKFASISTENRKERSLRKKEISVAGTEARRKRKELMKLKSRLHHHLLGRENG